MILVTGAGGKTGRAIIANLVKRNLPVRAWLYRPFVGFDGAETFVGDMTNLDDWKVACRGITKIYLIAPNMHPDEVAIGQLAVDMAKKVGIKHFVYHSVLHPQTQEMPHHWNKLLVEEMVLASGIPFTILQPTAYMQNLLPQWADIQVNGVFRMPYPAGSAISLVDLEDVAIAAGRVLESENSHGATLELVGTMPLSQTAVAATLTEQFKRQIRFEEIPLDTWEQANRSLPPYTRETLMAMFRYYTKHGLAGNPFILKAILGRSPRSLGQFIQARLNA